MTSIKLHIKQMLGKFILKGCGECVAAYLLKERGNIMSDVTTTKSSLLTNLLTAVLVSGATYLQAKNTDSSAGWVSSGARSALLSSLISIASSYVSK